MTGKAKRKRRRHNRHPIPDYRRAVLGPLRQALLALIVPRLNGGQRFEVPRLSEVMRRLSGERASEHIVRRWLNGTRRAPAWFVDVLDGELLRQIEHRADIREKLAEIKAQCGDRRRGALARARMREHWRAGDPRFHTGKRMGEAARGDSVGKNDPHN